MIQMNMFFKIEQIPMAFPSLNALFMGHSSLLKTQEIMYTFLFLFYRS